MQESLIVSIWRGGEDGKFVDDDVPRLENQTALEFLPWRDWQKTLAAVTGGDSLAAGLPFLAHAN